MAIEGITSLRDPKSFKEAQKYALNLFYKNRYTDKNPYSGDAFGTFNPRAIQNYIKNLLREMEIPGFDSNRSRAGGISKSITFIMSRTALHLLNPTFGMGVLYNPLSALGPPPGASGLFTNVLDPVMASSNPGSSIARREDRLKSMYEGNYVKIKAKAGIPPVDVEGPMLRFDNGKTLGQMMKELNIGHDGLKMTEALLYERQEQGPATKQENINGVNVIKPDYEKIFSRQKTGPGFIDSGKGYEFFKPNISVRTKPSLNYLVKKKAMANDDIFFSVGDTENGYVDDNLEVIGDNDAYIPFYFSDLRRPERRLYFRAFINELTEDFTPEWSKEKYYGRVDPVGTYMNTTRIIRVGFKIVAMSNVGLSTMWKKINNFLKMMYPTYSSQGVLEKSPLVRMRIGDLIADSAGRGLPGFIENANFAYNESPWEIDSYQKGPTEIGKVPMACNLSLTFQVIHEQNPAVDMNYNFNQIYIRRMGTIDRFGENENE